MAPRWAEWARSPGPGTRPNLGRVLAEQRCGAAHLGPTTVEPVRRADDPYRTGLVRDSWTRPTVAVCGSDGSAARSCTTAQGTPAASRIRAHGSAVPVTDIRPLRTWAITS